MKLSRIRILALLLLTAFFSTACALLIGDTGEPGDSYLGVWLEYSEADDIYAISCDALPSSFVYGHTWYGEPATSTTYYLTPEGTYNYSYQLHWYSSETGDHYSTIWSGTLTIENNPGSRGSFPFKDGEDGEDKAYSWVLGWSGSTVNYSRTDSGSTASGQDSSERVFVQKKMEASATASLHDIDLKLYDAGPLRVLTWTDGTKNFTLSERPYSLKGTLPPASKRGQE